MNRVKLKSKDGYYVVKPSVSQEKESKKVSNKAFREAVESGAYFRDKLNSVLRAQGIWDEEKQKYAEELSAKIEDGEKKLKACQNLEEGKAIALEIRQARLEQVLLLTKQRELDIYTVEAQAENAGFDYLVSVCLVNEEGKKVFKDLEDYYENKEEEFAIEAAQELMTLRYNVDKDWQTKLPENKYLLKNNLCDKDLRLINDKGELISIDGRRITENGFFIREDGKLENSRGEIVDEKGNVIEE